jgi:hypothetical protein
MKIIADVAVLLSSLMMSSSTSEAVQDGQDGMDHNRGNEYPPDIGVVPVQALEPALMHQRLGQLRTGDESTGK